MRQIDSSHRFLWRPLGLGVLCGVLLSGALPARATVLRGLDLGALCRRSGAILRGRVVRTRARWVGGRIYTAVTLRVSHVLLGAASPGAEVTFYRLGGEVGRVGQIVSGAPRFSPGESVVVFLRSWRGRWFVTGMAQGKLPVLPARPGHPAQVLPPAVGVVLLGAQRVLRRPVAWGTFAARVRALLPQQGRSIRPVRRGRPQ